MANKPVKYVDTKGRASWRLRWRYGGTKDGAWQTVTWDRADDIKALKAAIEVRGHMVRSSDPEVRDRSIVTGLRTAASEERPEAPAAPTWHEAFEAYMEDHDTLARNSKAAYRQVASAHLSVWDDLPVSDITVDHVKRLIREHRIVWQGRGHLRFVVADIVLRDCVRKGWITTSPANAKALTFYAREGGEVATYLTEEEVGTVLTAARTLKVTSRATQAHAYADMVEVMLGTGLRRGEVSGLKVRDLRVGRYEATLTVERTVDRQTGEGVVSGPTKSGESRQIVLTPDDAAILSRYAKGKRRDDWLWLGSEPVCPRRFRGWWIRVVAHAQTLGLDAEPRLHDLRHTHASHLIEAGVPLLAVSRRLGHKNVRITEEVYGHLGGSSDAQIIAALTAARPTKHLRAV